MIDKVSRRFIAPDGRGVEMYPALERSRDRGKVRMVVQRTDRFTTLFDEAAECGAAAAAMQMRAEAAFNRAVAELEPH